MARNEEKAMAMLNRFRAQQELELKGPKLKRPYHTSNCKYVPDAEKWRLEVIHEISKKVSQIQNAGLGEFKIRDLNDEINKLLNEKRHWEERILELGGKDYSKIGPKMLDHEGKEVPGNRGYRYFGAAKDLPGVRELFESAPPQQPRRTRAELFEHIDADYYGYRDDDDNILIPLEREQEAKAIAEAVAKWEAVHGNSMQVDYVDNNEDETDIYKEAVEKGTMFSDNGDSDDNETIPFSEYQTKKETSVPTQQDVEKMLVERKKKELLAKFGGMNTTQ